MTKRIFRATLTVALTVLLASLVLIVGVLHGYFQDRVLEELASRTSYIALGIEHEGMAYLGRVSQRLPGDLGGRRRRRPLGQPGGPR